MLVTYTDVSRGGYPLGPTADTIEKDLCFLLTRALGLQSREKFMSLPSWLTTRVMTLLCYREGCIAGQTFTLERPFLGRKSYLFASWEWIPLRATRNNDEFPSVVYHLGVP